MDNIIVSITPRMYAKIFAYTTECTTEISGFGSYNRDGVIDNLFPLLSQTCSSAETEMSQEALAQFASSGLSAKVNVHWHSHVNMGVFWSATDKENVESLVRLIPILVSIVVNKKGEYKARLDYSMPTRLTFDDISLQILVPPLPEGDRNKITDEIEDKVGYSKGMTFPSGRYIGSDYYSGRAYGAEGEVVVPSQEELFYISHARERNNSKSLVIPQWVLDLPDKKMRREIIVAIRRGKYTPEMSAKNLSTPPVAPIYTIEEMNAFLDSFGDAQEPDTQQPEEMGSHE